MSRERLPNLVIAGVPKAASTSLFDALSAHPNVCASRMKETHYFLPLRYGEPLPPLEEYVDQFRPRAGQTVLMEATPAYFYGGPALVDRMASILTGAKILMILRDPVARAVSFFRWHQSRLELPAGMTLDDYLKRYDSLEPHLLDRRENNRYWAVHGGRYADWLPDWTSRFGDRVRVVFFEDLVSDPDRLLTEIVTWLGLPAAPLSVEAANATNQPRSAVIHSVAMKSRDRLEPVLMRVPRLRAAARNTFLSVNKSRRPADLIAPEVLADLRDRLREPTARLAPLLPPVVLGPFPTWVQATE
jgi:hypothetical protein